MFIYKYFSTYSSPIRRNAESLLLPPKGDGHLAESSADPLQGLLEALLAEDEASLREMKSAGVKFRRLGTVFNQLELPGRRQILYNGGSMGLVFHLFSTIRQFDLF